MSSTKISQHKGGYNGWMMPIAASMGIWKKEKGKIKKEKLKTAKNWQQEFY
jgi:hypothetical protein